MAREEDIQSLEGLYQAYASSVFSYLLRLSGNKQIAEDLTSETFYRAVLSIESFRQDASVKTWLLVIARNLFLRHLKHEQRIISLERMQDNGVRFAAKLPNPEIHYINSENGTEIQQALLLLSEKDRTILLLSSQENLPYREIAIILEISLSAVKVRIHRARKRFAIIYQEIQDNRSNR